MIFNSIEEQPTNEIEEQPTTNSRIALVLLVGVFVIGCAQLKGEAQGVAGTAAQSTQAPAAPPPATKMEGFKPAAGSVLVFGYDDPGSIVGISVDVREMRDTKGSGVRGLLVEVTESQYRKERSLSTQMRFQNCLRVSTLCSRSRPIQRPSRISRFAIRPKASSS